MPEDAGQEFFSWLDEASELSPVRNGSSIVDFFLDSPSWLAHLVMTRKRWRSIRWLHDSNDPEWIALADDNRTPAARLADAEAISSDYIHDSDDQAEQSHYLMLDIDHPAALLPSSTEGHSHLIIKHELGTEAWREIIAVLGKHGVIEEGYAEVSLRRGATYLRLPWIHKSTEEEDQLRAFSDWLDHDDDFTTPGGYMRWTRGLHQLANAAEAATRKSAELLRGLLAEGL